MNEPNIAEQALSAVLTDDELDQAVGGSNPIDPIGGVTGGADLDLKATPILL